MSIERPIRLDLGTLSTETAFQVPEVPWDRVDLSGYASPAGDAHLRELAAEKLRERNNLQVTADNVVITTGASGGLLATLASVANAGETVALPDPGYPGYRAMASLLGLRVVDYPATGNVAEALVDCIAQTAPSVIVVNSPGNPTGRVLHRSAVAAIVDVAVRSSTWLISDEVYEDFVFDGEHVSGSAYDPAAPVISVFSLSKSFGLAGWRIGYVTAPHPQAATIARKHWGAVMSAPGSAQIVAAIALRTGYRTVATTAQLLRARRDRLAIELRAGGLDAVAPAGGIFFWILAPDRMDGATFAAALWRQRRVAVQGGATFGRAGRSFFRLNFAADRRDVEEALERIYEFIITKDFTS